MRPPVCAMNCVAHDKESVAVDQSAHPTSALTDGVSTVAAAA